jgi:transcription antitermination protein NusB
MPDRAPVPTGGAGQDPDSWSTSDASMPAGNVSARRKARKRALDVLYQADLRSAPIRETLSAYLGRLPEPRPEHLTYTVRLVEGVASHQERIDEVISSYAEGWTLDRMPVIDRNLARIAVFELLYADDIDAPVAITEAVELARSLSTDDSPRYLNGVLGRIAEYVA